MKTMRVEGVGYNIGGHQKIYIGDVAGARVENILYYITFGKHVTKDVGGC